MCIRDSGTGVRTSGDEPRSIVVAENGSATSCTLPFGPPQPISATDFSQSCTTGNDAECTLVAEGDVCTPCSCPSAAIATSALEAYSAEVRSRRATCTSPVDSPACAACVATTSAKCVAGKCAAVPN